VEGYFDLTAMVLAQPADIANFFRGGNAVLMFLAGRRRKDRNLRRYFIPTGETSSRKFKDGLFTDRGNNHPASHNRRRHQGPALPETSEWVCVDFMGGVSVGERTSLHFGLSNWGIGTIGSRLRMSMEPGSICMRASAKHF